MTNRAESSEADERIDLGLHNPLPLVLERVLNGDAKVSRAGGWNVEAKDDKIEVGRYIKPPETGGDVDVVARIPLQYPEEDDDS